MVVPQNTASPVPQGNPGPLVYASGLLLWYIFALLGLQYVLTPAHVTLIWLSSGITVGLLLITASSRRPLLLAAIGVLHALINATSSHTPAGAIAIAAAYCIEAWVVVFVFERLMAQDDRSLTTLRSIAVFSLAAAIGTPAVTGFFGALVCNAVYGPLGIEEAWFIWSVTDSMGIILFAPLVVVWSRWRPADALARGLRPLVTTVLSFILLAFLLELLIGSHLPIPLPVFSRAYLAFPLVFLWTYRYGIKGATVALLPVAAVMLWNALDGPWSMIWPSIAFPRVVTVQLFIVALAVSGLSFAALLKERSLTLERLRSSADHQRELARRLEVQVERLPLGLIALDRTGITREWNPAAEAIFGYGAGEMIGLSLADRLIPVDRRHVFVRLQDEAEKGDRSFRTITPALRKDGADVQIEWNATPLRGEGGVLWGILVTAQDVTERGRSEKKIQRLNRLYAFLSQINQAIVRARSHDELFQSVCGVAVQHGKFRFAWIGELKPGAATIDVLAFAGDGNAYLEAVRQTPVQGAAARRLPILTAIQTQQVEIVQRIGTDTRMSPWFEQARACGFASSVSLPLQVAGILNGCLDVYAGESDYFDAEEMAVLLEIRGDLLFALGNLVLDGHMRSAREALHASETRFRSIVESIDDLVFTLDCEQRHTGAYGGELARSGIDAASFVGRTPVEIFGAEAGAIHVRHNDLALQGKIVQYEWSIGEGVARRTFSTKLSPQVAANGTIVGITGVARDITSRIQIEEDLRFSREQFSGLFHFSPLPTVLAHAGSMTILDVNHAAEQWTGFSRDDIVGKSPESFSMFTNPADQQRVLGELSEEGSLNGTECDITVRDGSVRRVALYATAMTIGVDRYVISKVVDITDRNRAEVELQEERALLARRVEERTAELRLANDALAREARLKDEFLASMSHELRTPLTGILGMAEALQMQVYGSLNERQGKAVRTIGESGQHLLELINDILDLSRIEAGKMSLQDDIVVVADTCEGAMAMVRQAAGRKHQHLATIHDERVHTMRADPRRLKQVLVNLLSNAVKFTPDGGAVTLEVVGDPDNARVTFRCRDTGIGIASHDLPKLFQPFVQLDNRLAREYPGSGLGLSLVHHIVELHGGSVRVESEPGKGSEFTVLLPWRSAAAPPPKLEPSPLAGTVPGADPTTEHPVLLIVDDNETTRSLFADYFGECGYEILLAHNGVEAIRLVDDAHCSAVLMDVQMPGIDGLTAIRTIRTAEQKSTRKGVPIVALTALTMPGDRERCLAAGADAYISKPVDLRSLEATVRDLINGSTRA